MVTTEERMKVLQMIQEDKISVEDGAKLLATLTEQQRSSRGGIGGGRRDPRMLRVRVSDALAGKLKVNVSLPMALVDAGLNIASNYMDDEKLEQTETLMQAIKDGTTGKILDFEDQDGGEHVQVFLE